MEDFQEILTVFTYNRATLALKMASEGEANIIEIEDFPGNVDLKDERGNPAYFAVEFNSQEMYNKFMSAKIGTDVMVGYVCDPSWAKNWKTE